jgi:hypothetical protein
MPKLKVYRTPIGFHDAYVAAPSQKAALKAWGAKADLFARGGAEVVTEGDLAKAPLAHPGEVIRLLRGTEAQHIKALGQRSPTPRVRKGGQLGAEPDTREPPARANAPKAASADEPAPETKKHRRPRTRPRPSRAALDKAEAAIRDAEARHAAELKALAERKRALEQEQRDMRIRQAGEMARLDAGLQKASAAFRNRLESWAAES